MRWRLPREGWGLHSLGAVLAAAALLPVLAACGGTDPVVIATVGDYHPFDFINEEGEIDGLERELGDELCRRADLECVWVLNDWETLIPALMAGEFDVILAGMSITAEREERIDFTEAYYPPTPSVYVARGRCGGRRCPRHDRRDGQHHLLRLFHSTGQDRSCRWIARSTPSTPC